MLLRQAYNQGLFAEEFFPRKKPRYFGLAFLFHTVG
jgi:hypothetical protein